MKEKIEKVVEAIAKDLFHVDAKANLTRPEVRFGDFSTNIALQLANASKRNPMDVANQMAELIRGEDIEKVSVVAPGFINILLTSKALRTSYLKSNHWTKSHAGEQILVEFGNANPFKEMHLGHLYSAVIGDGIARLLEASGAEVKRVSYHGDVGLQVAKWIWALGEDTNWDLSKVDKTLESESIGYFYTKGSKAYDNDENAQQSITEINQKIYSKSDDKVNEMYKKGFDYSFKKFDEIFAQLQVTFDKRYLESQSSEIGLKLVRENIPKVFEESEGAVIFRGEKAGLHTVVFINSKGLPTYGAKDLGLTQLKKQDFPSAKGSIVITASEQTGYFKVMLAALAEVDPITAELTTHLAHGFLNLTTGKMSSRTGDIFEVKQLLGDVKQAIEKEYPNSEINDQVFLAAVKYTLLRQRIGPDIVFDAQESVSLEGNSGPYIQYAHARARSILSKTPVNDQQQDDTLTESFQSDERVLAMKISEFPEIVDRAINEYMPHHICTYLYELAQSFNRFYETNRVIDDPRMPVRISLVRVYADVLKSGLGLLNIPAPERM